MFILGIVYSNIPSSPVPSCDLVHRLFRLAQMILFGYSRPKYNLDRNGTVGCSYS